MQDICFFIFKTIGRRRSGSNETPANRNKANKSTGKSSSRRKPSDNMNQEDDGGGIPDNVSETGTYTIESESQDVVEARQRIDDVFGINGNVERVSDADTDKDISDEEIVEEAVSKDVLNVEHAGYHRKVLVRIEVLFCFYDGNTNADYMAEFVRRHCAFDTCLTCHITCDKV